MDLYLFDFDRTLYHYDSTRRLPAQSRLTGVSEYHLAKSWWAAGFEARAETGDWPTAAEYLDEFARVTGARLSLDQWAQARSAASTPDEGMIRMLARASSLGTVAVFSNNPSPFLETLPTMAAPVVDIVGDNVVVSFQLGVRKPDPEASRLALARFGASPANAFFVDDNLANVEGAASIGIDGFHYRGEHDLAALGVAIDAFAARND